MEVRAFQVDDYDKIAPWWVDWGQKPVPIQFLPPTGIVAEKDGVLIAAVFIYKTDTPICWIENYVSDKGADRSDRDAALGMVIDGAISVAKGLGFIAAMSSINHPVLMKRLGDHGFIRCDENLVSFVRGL